MNPAILPDELVEGTVVHYPCEPLATFAEAVDMDVGCLSREVLAGGNASYRLV